MVGDGRALLRIDEEEGFLGTDAIEAEESRMASPRELELLEQGRNDDTTVAEVSVMFYYT